MNLTEMKALSGAQQEALFKQIDRKRHAGKGTNYAAQYGAGGPTIARAAGVEERVGYKLHEAYWAKNWSVKAIAEDCTVKVCKGQKWLLNPISGLYYWLKADRDRFSTLCQGGGTYCFDMWLKKILEKRRQLNGNFHDEGIFELKKGNRKAMTKILKDSVQEVNKELGLNKALDCDVAFGGAYDEIH